jgi:protein-S-isoprenylcysteine O-methyltransferase Ste14
MTKIDKETAKELFEKEMVHFVLSHSYLVFLFAVILGVVLDMILPIRIFSYLHKQHQYIGLIFMLVSSILIYWAQSSSLNYKTKTEKIGSKSYFERGPYEYSRHPTHLGLLLLTIGFGLIINSPFSIILAFIAYISSILFFLKKEENLLERKYGETYLNYKKKTRNWI